MVGERIPERPGIIVPKPGPTPIPAPKPMPTPGPIPDKYVKIIILVDPDNPIDNNGQAIYKGEMTDVDLKDPAWLVKLMAWVQERKE